MAKFYGVIGFVQSVETSPGVWTDQVTEEEYIGDFIRSARGWRENQQVNANISLDTRISIIADPNLYQNFMHIRYVRYNEGTWSITNVELQRPRVILTTGEVYNG